VDLELRVQSGTMNVEKEVHPVRDDGNVIRCFDANRSQRAWTINCLLTTAEMETLITYYRSATTTDNPKLRIYDKSTTPFYNEYKVYFADFSTPQFQPGSGGKWQIKLVLRERTQ
jgi:hypothetical protein